MLFERTCKYCGTLLKPKEDFVCSKVICQYKLYQENKKEKKEDVKL